MRALGLLTVVVLLSGCGGSSGAQKDTGRATVVASLSGKAAERVGAASCRHLPPGTLPQHATHAAKLAAVRAYLAASHPNDDLAALMRGCRRERRF